MNITIEQYDKNSLSKDITIDRIGGTNPIIVIDHYGDEYLAKRIVIDRSVSSGSSDYRTLMNKPKIEGVTLGGNLSAADLNLASLDDLDDKVDKVEGKGLSTNDYTTAEKNKLSGIASGAEVNQNAFSNVKVGGTTVSADSKTDTFELVAGDNVALNASNDKITINAIDTKYNNATTSAAGLMSASDKVKLNGIASGAEVNVQSDWAQADTSADDYIKNKPTIDATMSASSTNAVQNKTVKAAIDAVRDIADTAVNAPLEGVSIDGSANNIVSHYFECSTAAATAAKVATDNDIDFTLHKGARVIVKFAHANGAANPTLNINSTGAKSINRFGTTPAGNEEKTSWKDGAVVELLYDGTVWQMASSAGGGSDIEPLTEADIDEITSDIDESGSVILIDDELDSTSENPVQNKVIKTALDGKMDASDSGTNYTKLADGTLICWGEETIASGSTNVTVVFPQAFINTAYGFSVMGTFQNTRALTWATAGQTTAQIVVYRGVDTFNYDQWFRWMAVGRWK